jgi:hypothetical protein
MSKICINTKLTQDDYIKVSLLIVYSKRLFIALGIAGILMLIGVPFAAMHFSSFPTAELVCGIIFTVGFPAMTYFNARKNFRVNKRISEAVRYEMDETNIIVTGESFNSTLSWDKIYSVTENKKYVLIWLNPIVASAIPKQNFSVESLANFKEIVRKQSQLKNKLKYY